MGIFRRWQAPAAIILVMAAACSGTPSRPPVAAGIPVQVNDVLQLGSIWRPPVRAASSPVSPAALQPFADCSEVLSYLKKNAASIVGPYGLPHTHGGTVAIDGTVVLGTRFVAGEAAPQSAAMSSSTRPAHSTTNVQEAGIDEPDIVKTDGTRALIVAAGRLRVVDVGSGTPRELGSLPLPSTGERGKLLVSGSRVIVISQDWGSPDRGVPVSWRNRPRTVVRVVEAGDPANLRIVTTLYAEGRFVSARLIDGQVRLVLSNAPALTGFIVPQSGSTAEEKRATTANRQIVRRSSLDQWMPHFAVVDRRGPEIRRSGGQMGECGSVRHPPVFSGIEMVTVATIDPEHPGIDGAASVVGAGEIVYASARRIYVATAQWRNGEPAATTDIHAFDITDPRGARYVASGSVPGTVLNQYSLSEHEGMLRIATTTGARTEGSVSAIYVLQQRERILVPVGHVGGLGVGERIYAVRFIGALGYVVTFRETDPLYVVDLREPTRPVVRGELKIEGFSSYLHPVGEDLLLGVGQNATTEGQMLGAQMSLFDVSDPASPKRIDVVTLEDGTYASSDPLSFLYWPATGLTVVPVAGHDGQSAVGLRVRDRSLTQLPRRVTHPSEEGPAWIERSFVAGNRIYTLSEGGLMAGDLGSLEQSGWLPWPAGQ